MSDVSTKAPKGPRSETVTVRLDPKLRYFAEIAARKHRRTLSSFIEWAIEMSLDRVQLQEAGEFSEGITISDEISKLWDVDEPDRFVRLALRYPALLTHEEQVLWKLLRENGLIWKGHFDAQTSEWTWTPEQSKLIEVRLREYWPLFRAVADGTKPRSMLPDWVRTRPSSNTDLSSDSSISDEDEEIPF